MIADWVVFGSESGETLGRWFYTNAPAAWISAVMAISTLIYVLGSRKKAKRIIVREVRNSSLIQIWPGIRHKITVAFDGKPITGLGQIDLELFNSGSESIENADVAIMLSKDSKILGYLIQPEHPTVKAELVDNNTVKIALSFLNSVKEHGHLISLSLLLEDRGEITLVTGMGQGWSVKYSALPAEKNLAGILGAVLGFSLFWEEAQFFMDVTLRNISASAVVSLACAHWRQIFRCWLCLRCGYCSTVRLRA